MTIDRLPSRHVAVALTFLASNYRNNYLRLADVARAVGVSAAYLDRLLTRDTGSSFLVHLHQRRVAMACECLALRQMSVKEVAFLVGYKHVVELDRHFKRIHGATPSEWRRRQELLTNSKDCVLNPVAAGHRSGDSPQHQGGTE